MRRAEQIEDPQVALSEIRAGHKMFYDKCCMSAGQFRSWSIAKLLAAVSAKQLFIARERITI